ncbi:MAG: DNA-binding protein [Verrucomicrobia bacterium GWC2_42_7]|nr:MAG: DNA-binding protein [Verrucomicrobia bacterium GWC2_42_7]
MNKSELIVEIQKHLGKDATKASAEGALEAVLAAFKAGIKKDKAVQLIGFGTFSVATRAARVGLNPRTKEKIKIPATKSVKFKPGSALKELV